MPRPSGMPMHADDVLDHLVGGLEVERVLAGGERAEVRCVQQPPVVDGADPLFDAELVELGNPQAITNSLRTLLDARLDRETAGGDLDIDHSETSTVGQIA